MKLWASLYLMIWLAFLEIILVLPPLSGVPYRVWLHILLGILIVVLAFYNRIGLVKTEAPDRIKRIANAIAILAVVQGIIGIIFYLNIDFLYWISDFLHVVLSIAIITQASSVATAYDMWEEKEFERIPKPEELKSTPTPEVQA